MTDQDTASIHCRSEVKCCSDANIGHWCNSESTGPHVGFVRPSYDRVGIWLCYESAKMNKVRDIRVSNRRLAFNCRLSVSMTSDMAITNVGTTHCLLHSPAVMGWPWNSIWDWVLLSLLSFIMRHNPLQSAQRAKDHWKRKTCVSHAV